VSGGVKKYRATVRVPHASGRGSMVVWATVTAASPIAAKAMLEAQYGRGNVVGALLLSS
jgi:hypothetical protein